MQTVLDAPMGADRASECRGIELGGAEIVASFALSFCRPARSRSRPCRSWPGREMPARPCNVGRRTVSPPGGRRHDAEVRCGHDRHRRSRRPAPCRAAAWRRTRRGWRVDWPFSDSHPAPCPAHRPRSPGKTGGKSEQRREIKTPAASPSARRKGPACGLAQAARPFPGQPGCGAGGVFQQPMREGHPDEQYEHGSQVREPRKPNRPRAARPLLGVR